MIEEKDLIRIQWKKDKEQEPVRYMLVSETPGYEELMVSVSSEDMSERVAKAKLIQKMYELGKEKGIPASRLRFKINGIEE